MEEEGNTKFCSNCQREIPAVNYVMHVTHCQRNLTLCKECGEPVPIAQQKEHFEENHAQVKCECGASLEKMDMENHKEKDCPRRNVSCQYCELDLPFSEMAPHVEYCGSRTEKCEKCDRYVQKKDLDEHLFSDCNFPAKEEKLVPLPPISQGDSLSSMPASMLHAIGLGDHFDSSPYEYYFPPSMSDKHELKRIMHTGFRTPPFSDPLDEYPGSHPYFTNSNGFMNNGAISRSQGARRITPKSEHELDSYYNFDSDEEDFSQHVCDDEVEAARFYADGLDHGKKTSEVFGDVIDNPLPSIQSAVIADDGGTDETELPCEFCGGLFPIDALILHQSGCQLNSMHPYHRVAFYPLKSCPHRSLPPLNNSPTRAPHYSPTFQQDDDFHVDSEEETTVQGKTENDTLNDTFLPCEFCQELFPLDSLIHHQAACDAGPTSRPPSAIPNTSELDSRYLNNSRPVLRNPQKSRPSRPVYETEGTNSLDDFIPGELGGSDAFLNNSDVDYFTGTKEVPRRRGVDIDRPAGRTNSPLNNEPYTARMAGDRPSLMMLRNNDLTDKSSSKGLASIKNTAVNLNSGKQRPDSTGTAKKYGAVASKDQRSYLKKTNPGTRRKETAEIRHQKTTGEPRITRDVSQEKATTRIYQPSKPKSERSRHFYDDHIGSSESGTDTRSDEFRRGMAERSRRPEFPRIPGGSDPRRNPPTKALSEPNRPMRGREDHAEISRQGSIPSPAPPKKPPATRKKIV